METEQAAGIVVGVAAVAVAAVIDGFDRRVCFGIVSLVAVLLFGGRLLGRLHLSILLELLVVAAIIVSLLLIAG